LMRRQTKAVKSRRQSKESSVGQTRAQFLGMLLGMSTREQVGYVRFFSPEESVKQTVKDVPKPDEVREKGLSKAKFTIKGKQADAAQRRNVEIALKVADAERASERATLAMLCAGIGESEFKAIPNAAGSDYGGVFQGKYKGTNPQFKLTDTEAMARCFLKGGKGFQGGGAMALATAHPDMSSGEIALTVEGSGSNFPSRERGISFYGQWEKEAEAILDLRGGVSRVQVQKQRYNYRAGGKIDGKEHEYWTDAVDIGTEVDGWRLFADINTLFYVSDEWLFSRKPAVRVERGHPAVLTASFDADVGVKVAEIEFTVLTDDWALAPAAVVEVAGYGPFDGRWLQANVIEDLMTDQATITLHRPAPKRKEPAPKSKTITRTESDPEAGTARQRIVAAARKAVKLDGQTDYLHYRQIRPMPDTLFPSRGGGRSRPLGGRVLETDCSGFATLVYKAAGQPDPNGGNYSGNGYTGTLAANGKRTSDPQPGDLGFYGSGPPWGHVVVYLGGGEVASFGSDPGPRILPAHYRSDGPHWYTYDLED
jgi:hypothetical protein